MSNTEFAKSGQSKQSEDEYICDEKENCKNSLECKGCYPQEEPEFNSDELKTYNLTQLRKIGKDKQLKGYSYVSKNELIKMIVEDKNWLDIIKKEEEEFDGDKLDNILYPDGLDWTFEKPTKGKYHTIYIIKKEEDEETEFAMDCNRWYLENPDSFDNQQEPT